jgi:acetyl-CoA C-acetyltransferase
MQNIRKVAILGGSRIPFCRSLGRYKDLGNLDMLAAALGGLVEKYNLEDKTIGEVASGAVLKRSKDFSLAREGLLAAKLHPSTNAFDVGKACGTSLEAAVNLGNKIALGQIDSAIASGVDSSSDVPIELSEKFSRNLAQMSRARNMIDRAKLFKNLSIGDIVPKLPGVKENRTGLTMGEHCELMAQEWKLTREEQDQLAVESHHKAASAWERGFYQDIVIPFHGAEKDDNIRPDTSMDKMKKLRPCFEKSERGTMTAANSTPLTDGAAAVLMSSEQWAKDNGIEPMAYLTHSQSAAVNFEGEEGLLMAPAYAVSQMLDKAGLTFDDIDFFEVHEAFAAQAICTLKAWESEEFCQKKLGRSHALGSIDRSKLNLAGGSVALGHPFAATGARILAGAAKLLKEKGSGRCLISICTAGGMGICAILER